MIRLTVSDEQSRDIRASRSPVEVCDHAGRPIGVLVTGITAADIDRAKRSAASTEHRYTTDEVLLRLRSCSDE